MKAAAYKASALRADKSMLACASKSKQSNKGFTLIETVVTIAIIAIAMTGIIAVWSSAAAKGSDPFWHVKVESLGKIYLDKIATTPYSALNSTVYSDKAFEQEGLEGYQGFSVNLDVEFVGQEFSLTQKKLKKATINITSPLGNKQQFVTYRGNER